MALKEFRETTIRSTPFSFSGSFFGSVLAYSGLGRLSHSCLSGPEQQGRCEEGDCQEAAVAGGSKSRYSCIRQLCHWAFSTPLGCRQLLSPWQLPSSGLSCPSPRAKIITRWLKIVGKPTQSTACLKGFRSFWPDGIQALMAASYNWLESQSSNCWRASGKLSLPRPMRMWWSSLPRILAGWIRMPSSSASRVATACTDGTS